MYMSPSPIAIHDHIVLGVSGLLDNVPESLHAIVTKQLAQLEIIGL